MENLPERSRNGWKDIVKKRKRVNPAKDESCSDLWGKEGCKALRRIKANNRRIKSVGGTSDNGRSIFQPRLRVSNRLNDVQASPVV